jgi:two-component system, OmpR family, phosphate regulon sensor histidine kinase PhoR
MKAFFPWRLFWKFFFTLVLLMNLLMVTAVALASLFTPVNLELAPVVSFLASYFFLSLATAAAFSYRFASPLKRVILKALRIANRKKMGERPQDDKEILEEEPGEYFELEVALDKIRRKMKRRRMQLAQEREESQALMSALEDAVLSVDLNTRIKFFNSRFATVFLNRAQADGLHAGESIPLSNIFRDPALLDLFKVTLNSGEAQTAQLKINSVIAGTERHYIVKVSPLRQEKTTGLYGAMALFHDVTDLRKSERIRMEFVENASHELRTPLTSMKGFVDTAKEDIKAGKTEQLGYFLGIISKSADRLSELVNDMLTLSSLESANVLKKETLSTRDFTKDCIEELSGLANEKNIEIQVEANAQSLLADRSKAEQVLHNLLGNAIKYLQVGGKVLIKWEEDDQFVTLHVVDNGPGIADMHLNRLFERFYRVDKGRSRDVGGTGLGLAIVKHIMQNHRGSVVVKSEVGKGSEFICSFSKSP